MAMHSYEADGRTRVTLTLATVAVLLAWLLSALFAWFLGELLGPELSWLLSAPSMPAFFSAAYWAFDRYVWRLDILRKVGFVTVPNLDGEWKGEVKSKSSHGGDGLSQPASVVIHQRWSKMAIRLNTEHSRSYSTLAAFKTDDAMDPELTYLYFNEPSPDAQETMEAHRGTAILELSGGALVGRYYSGRGRQGMGKIELKRAR